MKLDAKALALSLGIVWGAAVFLVGAGNLLWLVDGAVSGLVLAWIYNGASKAARSRA